jgi:hypothetical protein
MIPLISATDLFRLWFHFRANYAAPYSAFSSHSTRIPHERQIPQDGGAPCKSKNPCNRNGYKGFLSGVLA